MPDCPRCHQSVEPQAIACSYCGTQLKAYGHPGIPLHRAANSEYLCQTCAYDEDDTCTFPQRPYAKECTLYTERSQVNAYKQKPSTNPIVPQAWIRRNLKWLVLLALLAASLLPALQANFRPNSSIQNPSELQRTGGS